jgi:hypothetical protein
MHSKSIIAQKNMVLALVVFLYDALPVKNIWHACSIEKYGCVVQVPLLAYNCYF